MKAAWPLLVALLSNACAGETKTQATASATVVAAPATPTESGGTPPPLASGDRAATDGAVVTVLLGGDTSFARSVGQRVLADPSFEPFAGIRRWLDAADLRFVNLESILSDQGGLTEHPHNSLVFAGPPRSAAVLRQAGIDVVSAANNHAWDYGKKGLVESLATLRSAGVRAVGASPERDQQYRPVRLDVRGLRLALLAFTEVWNDGKLGDHPARGFVADATYEAMRRAVRDARHDSDFVIVSVHAGNEYVPLPREHTRRFADGLLLSGADLVFGHHPHVLQGIEWSTQGKPILYSLGNLVFDSALDRADAQQGALALVRLRRDREGSVEDQGLELCPVTLSASLPVAGDPLALGQQLATLSRTLGGLEAGPVSPLGCIAVQQSRAPLPRAQRRGFAP